MNILTVIPVRMGSSRFPGKPLKMIKGKPMVQRILENCKKAKEKQIVVTHGTDTMTRTAKVIEKGRLKKTIVLTGAMIPYKFGSSDGLFNLGGAIAYAQALPY